MRLNKIKKAINKRLAPLNSRVIALSELPIIGKIDDPDGFLDDVKEDADNISYHYTAYISSPIGCHDAQRINEQLSYLGADIDFKLEKGYGIHK